MARTRKVNPDAVTTTPPSPTQSELKVEKTLGENGWTLTAEVLDGGVLPQDIFIFENTGTNQLGEFQGVCNFEELMRFQAWTGAPIVKFGNRFVRYRQAKIQVPVGTDTDAIVSVWLSSVKNLDKELKSKASSSEIFVI